MSYIQLLKLIEKYGGKTTIIEAIKLEKGDSNGK